MKKQFSNTDVIKSFHGREPWFNVFLLKFLTVGLTRILVNHTNTTPNFITGLSLLFGVASCYFFSCNNIFLGSMSYLASYICDAIDGKIARLTGNFSKYGAWLDIFVDRVVFALVSIGLGVSQLPPEFGLSLTSGMIFVFMLGFESRYNIQVVEVQELIRNNDREGLFKWHPVKKSEKVKNPTKYEVWLEKKGLVQSPFTIVEMLIVLFVVSPLMGLYFEAALLAIGFLLIRLIAQQRFWTSL
jgi:hypothetical protein